MLEVVQRVLGNLVGLNPTYWVTFIQYNLSLTIMFVLACAGIYLILAMVQFDGKVVITTHMGFVTAWVIMTDIINEWLSLAKLYPNFTTLVICAIVFTTTVMIFRKMRRSDNLGQLPARSVYSPIGWS